MHNKAFTFGRAILIAWAAVGCSDMDSGATYLWNAASNYYYSALPDTLNEQRIPQVSVQYAGEIGLELKNKVELAFDAETPGIGMISWMGITAEKSLLFTDQVSGEAHEFSLKDGRHIRSFGRRGKGPGEYGVAQQMAMDSKGEIYIQDDVYGQLLRYDRQGQYQNKMQWIGSVSVLVNRDDTLFLLEKKHSEFIQVRRITDLNRR
jgi:hypothetical protein